MPNDLKSPDLDVVAISKTRISEKHAVESIFENYKVFSSCGLSGAGGSVVLLF